MAREPQGIPMTTFNQVGGSGTFYWQLIGAQIVYSRAMKEFCDISTYCIIVTAAYHEDIPWFKVCGGYGNIYYVPVNPKDTEYFSQFYQERSTTVPLEVLQIARWDPETKYSIIKRVKNY